MKKIYITEKVTDINLIVCQPIDDIIKDLHEIKKEYSNYKNLQVKECGGWDNSDLQVWGERLETDTEFEKRKRDIGKKKDKEEKKKQEHRRYIIEEAKKLNINVQITNTNEESKHWNIHDAPGH